MATSSERSPPPFPDSEDQELETEEIHAQDSDEGEDIFLGSGNPLEAKMDPAVPENDPAVPGSDITKPPSGPSQEPTPDLFSDPFSDPLTEHISQTENVATDQSANNIFDELTDAVVVTGDATADGGSGPAQVSDAIFDTPNEPTDVAEVTKDAPEEPRADADAQPDIPESSEDVSETLIETMDLVELTKDETEKPRDETQPASNIADVSQDVFETANESTDLVELTKDETELASNIADVSQDIFEMPNESTGVVELTKDETEEPTDEKEPASNIADVSEDIFEMPDESTDLVELTKDETEEPTEETEPASNIADVSADIFETATDMVEVELKNDELSPSVGAEAVSNVAELSQNLIEVPVDVAEPPTGHSEPAIGTDDDQQLVIDPAVIEALNVLDIFTEQAAKTDIMDPLSDLLMDVPVCETSAPVVNVASQPPRDLFDDEPSDLFAEPLLKSPGKKEAPVGQPSDLFEDEPSDLFSDPLANNAVKQEVGTVHDPDEDLFKDPIGATSNTPLNVTSDEVPVEKHVEAKAGGIGGPLGDDYLEDPGDIFTEEGVVTTPSVATMPSVVTVTGANPKTNGVHTDEESDIFAEATVELSLDSPRNDRKTKEVVAAPISALSVSASASSAKPPSATPEELEEEESGDNFEINISITNPEKVGDGMNAYMGYKVSTQTSLPVFRSKTLTVRRRFSDFLGLYEKLCEKHAHNGLIVPPPPEKSILGMTKVKVGKEDPSSAEFVERRRAALERYLQRVVCHPSLLQDPDVREFLEREELPRALSTQALSGAGFLKMISKATDAVSKMTIKMNESDVWFEEKLQEVESDDQQLRKLHAMVDSLVHHRKELSANTAGFSKSVAMLGSSEDHTALSRALAQLAEVEDKMEQLHQEQAANDSFTLAETLADYIRLLGSVRASFDQRIRAWQRWQDAQNMLQKKRETEAKLLWANKPDKLQQAKEDIAEWEAKVTQYERDFDRVSATVRKEVLRFEKEKARDFKKLVVKYLQALLQSQQQLIKYWEAFLPEAKAIA